MKKLVIFIVLALNLSFIHSFVDTGGETAPSPQGDTRMGADAATSGTDITDQDVQAQEDKPQDQPEIERNKIEDDHLMQEEEIIPDN